LSDVYKNKIPIRVAVLTASDRSARGERDDLSGRVLMEITKGQGWELVFYGVIPDDRAQLKVEMQRLADEVGASLILTTGGTGLAPRDVTPEATLDVIHKEVPGLAEAMRKKSMEKTTHAMLSRAVCGIRGETLIVNLPGSPRAVRECLEVILPAIPHAVELLRGAVSDCSRPAVQMPESGNNSE